MLHQYDHIFALGTIFAFLDAWNIGANDVANSWATSVGSRSVTYIQAMAIASVMELAGAVGVGARVADTIRTKVVNTAAFNGNAPVLMLGMFCAVTASSLYLTLATKIGLPVSTTHSIMGGVIGFGVASLGAGGVQWVARGSGTTVISSGVIQVFLAWIIAPFLSGIFGAIVFLITKYAVLLRKNPVMRGLMLVPVYFALTAALLVMLLLWKGGGYEVRLTDAQIPGVIVGVGAGWGLIIAIFLCPWLYRVVVKEDWQMRWYHIAQGPLLLRRGPVPPPPENFQGVVRNFYEGHLTREELEARRQPTIPSDVEAQGNKTDKLATSDSSEQAPEDMHDTQPARKSLVGPKPEKMFSLAGAYWGLKWLFLRGVDKDVVSMQSNKTSILAGDLEKIHASAAHYDNKAEFLYSFLQIMTASVASFTHGANDVANAIGPYATIYQIWAEGEVPANGRSDVPIWILVFGGVAIAIGIWTYGYNIMKNLGNRITLHSPSRGFSMELGSTITIIMATRLKLPISTTQCITGAVVGVGLCNGEWRAINWRMVAWIYGGWVITLPTAGLLSGLLMAFILRSPHWGAEY